MRAVDGTWTKKELYAECKRRGITGCSRLSKDELVRSLSQGGVCISETTEKSNTERRKEPTVLELREKCRQRGLKNYSKLKKDELVRLLKESENDGGRKQEEVKPREPTVEELRADCKTRGITGYSQLNKKELIQRMEDYSTDKGRKGTLTDRLRGGQHARMKGPLRSRAQERFDAGPSPSDTPGFLYIYFEPGSRAEEWKIGKTTLDPPERRMLQSASNNRKVYKLKSSWRVPWCGYVEKIVHLDLDDLQVVPGKEKEGGGGREDGGTEWFQADYKVVEARVRLAIRMVVARQADEADTAGFPQFCGMFSCSLPTRRRQRAPHFAGGNGKLPPIAVCRRETVG